MRRRVSLPHDQQVQFDRPLKDAQPEKLVGKLGPGWKNARQNAPRGVDAQPAGAFAKRMPVTSRTTKKFPFAKLACHVRNAETRA